jgi:tRNA-dihydrouridine synthase 4
MEHYSDLPFRLLTKKYGCNLVYTPMIHSKYKNFNKKRHAAESDKYLKGMFSTCPEDRPVFA